MEFYSVRDSAEDARERQREYVRRWASRHRDQLLASKRRFREENRERLREEDRERMRQFREANPEQARETLRRWREANPERERETARAAGRRYRARIRAAVFDHYGWACACCGSTDRPSIDHIGGNGRQHRQELFGQQAASDRMYRWLVRNGFPPGFQTLCRPCNRSKASGPACRINHAKAA